MKLKHEGFEMIPMVNTWGDNLIFNFSDVIGKCEIRFY